MFTADHASNPHSPTDTSAAAIAEIQQWQTDPTEAHQKAVSQPMPGDEKTVPTHRLRS